MFDIKSPESRRTLQRCVQYSWSQLYPYRARRKMLYDIFRGEGDQASLLGILPLNDSNAKYGTLLNLFQDYVKVHLQTLAFSNPKFGIRGRTPQARSISKNIELFLDRYMELLSFQELLSDLALDSAFGRCCAKVVNAPAPLGVNIPVAPRVFRLDPNNLILDQRAPSVGLSQWIGDAYLVDLEMAKSFEGYDSKLRKEIPAWSTGGTNNFTRDDQASIDLYISDVARLVDVFVAAPNGGVLYTWAVANDTFSEISGEPLSAIPYSFNPYCELSLLRMPSSLEEISRLGTLRGLHLATNDLTNKALNQALKSRVNPIDRMGNEGDMQALLDTPDRDPTFVNDSSNMGIFQIPGADGGLVNLAQQFASDFSKAGGSLELALGQGAAAPTARQTNLLAGQLQANQSVDRAAFERFVSQIGRKLVALAFENENLQIETAVRIPGTKYFVDTTWVPNQIPVPGGVSSFHFEVNPYSMSFRTPQEKVAQLNAASQVLLQWMTMAAQGAPINLEAVTRDVGESFDLYPDLAEWWSGQPPQPQQAGQAPYTTTATTGGGSTLRYEGNGGGSGGGDQFTGSDQGGGYSGAVEGV